VVSYGATGVPKGKIFIIDPKGVVSNASSKVLQQVGATLTMVSVSATSQLCVGNMIPFLGDGFCFGNWFHSYVLAT
jgi:hypothetical protein